MEMPQGHLQQAQQLVIKIQEEITKKNLPSAEKIILTIEEWNTLARVMDIRCFIGELDYQAGLR